MASSGGCGRIRIDCLCGAHVPMLQELIFDQELGGGVLEMTLVSPWPEHSGVAAFWW